MKKKKEYALTVMCMNSPSHIYNNFNISHTLVLI